LLEAVDFYYCKVYIVSMYQILPTKYNGYNFRSRTEARWAVFFEQLNIPFEYEKEGYNLDGVCYLPDFWMPSLNCFIEIKGETPTNEENEKARRLAEATHKNVFIFFENFLDEKSWGRTTDSATVWFAEGGWDNFHWFVRCNHCRKIGLVFNGNMDRLHCCSDNQKLSVNRECDITYALRVARGWRF
jgi:hypothetical protein